MITPDIWQATNSGHIGPSIIGSEAAVRDYVRSVKNTAWGRGMEHTITLAPACACCGRTAGFGGAKEITERPGGFLRCERHLDRSPCAVEGCARTTPAKGYYGSDNHLCATHWRLACPSGSRGRKAYCKLQAIKRKHGWDAKTRRKFDRLWDTIIARARSRSATGFIDPAQIDRMFGFDDG